MKSQRCFYCDKDIEGRHFMYPLETPYCNLFFHKSCLGFMGNYEEMGVYIAQNMKKLYNYLEKLSQDRKK